ncbi:MAG: radical SAM protein, partial [Chloroflexota bacterium]
WLSFPLLWKCDYAHAGEPCQFCFSGGEIATLARRRKPLPKYPSPEDVAEIVEYAIVKERCAKGIQITGGSLFNEQVEMETICNILNAIERRVGRRNIPGEILVYITPPTHPEQIDLLFEAGADRVSCSLEVWDEGLASKIMPGKMKFTGRKRHLDCLHYISSRHGKNKACCNFIIGLEPVESLLEGAEYMASHGIVPIASVWIPFGRPVLDSMKTPTLDYYQAFKTRLAQIYTRHGIVPPGGQGLNVCMCRDVYLNSNSLKVISQ